MHEQVELAVDGPLDLAMTMGLIGMSARDPSFRVFGRDTVAFATNTPSGAASAASSPPRDPGVRRWGERAQLWPGRPRWPAAATVHSISSRPPGSRGLVRRFAGMRLTPVRPEEIAMHAVFGQRVPPTKPARAGRASPAAMARRRARWVDRSSSSRGPSLDAPRLPLHVGLDLHRSRALTALAREADRLRATIDDVEPVSGDYCARCPASGRGRCARAPFRLRRRRAVPLDDGTSGVTSALR